MDDYRIEDHKLMFHLSRVQQWLNGELIYPIYIEIGPSGACNYRCSFCALDYLNYKPRFIDKNILLRTLSEVAHLGVKSIMYAGEGEPFLHKDIVELVLYTRKVGIDVSATTNGVFFDKDMARQLLPALTWVRVSFNAGKPETYAKIHRCRPEDFKTVLGNIADAVKLKNKNQYACTIGVQFLLLPDNYREITALAKDLKGIGIDYLIIKPYSQHLMSKNKINKNFDYDDYLYLGDKLQKLSDSNFKVIFRIHTMQKLKHEKPYKHCLSLPFWAYIDSAGNIYACSTFLGDKRFCCGNIYKDSFKEIWKSKKRVNIVSWAAEKLNTDKCRLNCRMDEINRYLWDLTHPSKHINFI